VINMESKKGRRVVGRLEAGTDIVEGLLDICQKHAIHTGQLHAIGYLKSAIVSHHPPEPSEDAERITVGACHAINFSGNISMQAETPVLHIQALLLETDSQELRAGRLRGGEVINIEFAIQSVDDFSLLRSEDMASLANGSKSSRTWKTAMDRTPNEPNSFPGE